MKFRFLRVKVCGVLGYGLNEENGKERERFWNDLDRTVDRVGNRYRLCILGDLNGWIGNRVRAGTIGAFGLLGKNDNGRRVVEFALKGVCVWLTQEWR